MKCAVTDRFVIPRVRKGETVFRTTEGGHTFREVYGSIDIFAFTGGGDHCNGPQCLDCGKGQCHHCDDSIYDEKCPRA